MINPCSWCGEGTGEEACPNCMLRLAKFYDKARRDAIKEVIKLIDDYVTPTEGFRMGGFKNKLRECWGVKKNELF